MGVIPGITEVGFGANDTRRIWQGPFAHVCTSYGISSALGCAYALTPRPSGQQGSFPEGHGTGKQRSGRGQVNYKNNIMEAFTGMAGRHNRLLTQLWRMVAILGARRRGKTMEREHTHLCKKCF